MHHVFIVNPAAGKGKALQMIDRIKSRFENSPQSFEIMLTEAPGHAKTLAREAVEKYGEVRLYSVGGDGTLNEVVNGMAGSNAELGIIPCGSGNDAVRSFYKITDPHKLIEILPDAASDLYDLGKVNDRYFINIASVGFDAEVALRSSAFKKFPFVSGSLAYVLGILYALIVLKKYKLRFKIGNTDATTHKERDFLLAVFANGSFYGGGMKPTPRAKIDDGLLDLCLVKPVSRLTVLRFFPLYMKGEHESMEYVETLRDAKAVFESDTPFPMNIDGEVFLESRACVDIIPKGIRVIIP